MTEAIKKFLEEVSKNTDMQKKLIKANKNYFRSVFDAATEQGINLTTEDVIQLLNIDENHDGKISEEELAAVKTAESQNNEASEEELAAVSGGTYRKKINDIGKEEFSSNCFCWTTGGGSADQYQTACGCFVNGFGLLTDFGKQEVEAGHIDYAGSSSAPVAMWCFQIGSGEPDY